MYTHGTIRRVTEWSGMAQNMATFWVAANTESNVLYMQNTIFETYYQIDRRERERKRTHKFFYALLLIIQQSFNIYTHAHTYIQDEGDRQWISGNE